MWSWFRARWRAINPEVQAALARRVPVVPRAEMLGELMRFRESIAVAGTHGKTTTTSLIASVLAEGGEDPTFVIGGRLKSAGSNARLGAGRYLVAEADESDASFMHLQPVMAVGERTSTRIISARTAGTSPSCSKVSSSFCTTCRSTGWRCLCGDDEHVQSILPRVGRPFLTYGLREGVDVRASQLERDRAGTRFTVTLPGRADALAVTLNLPGTHKRTQRPGGDRGGERTGYRRRGHLPRTRSIPGHRSAHAVSGRSAGRGWHGQFRR